MAVGLCLRVKRARPETIMAIAVALANLNGDLYTEGRELAAPWSLRWVPDEPARTSTLRDVELLLDDGQGSCGELAAAYAGYLWAREGRTDVQIDLIENGPDSWHVVASAPDGTVWDPAVIGGRHAA